MIALYFGVLRGKVDLFKREDDLDTPHLQIRVIDENNERWRIAVNVLSSDQSFLIFHRAEPLQSHPLLSELLKVKSGFTVLPESGRSASTSLDYLRAPLFDWPTGIAIPSAGPAGDDDLQDALTAYLKNLEEADGEIFAFGAKFPAPGDPFKEYLIDRQFGTKQGIHNIHMNQGNPAGRYAKDNGVFQDGGLILKFPNRFVGIFLRFKTQWLPTDNINGNRLPSSQEIPPGGSPVVGPGEPQVPSDVSNPIVYIERVLVNPTGDDPGKEVVVIGNTTTSSVDLTGWRILDKNNRAETVSSLQLPPGESRLVMLSGKGAQLGNKGGTIRLEDPSGTQIHAVSYSEEDAKSGGPLYEIYNLMRVGPRGLYFKHGLPELWLAHQQARLRQTHHERSVFLILGQKRKE